MSMKITVYETFLPFLFKTSIKSSFLIEKYSPISFSIRCPCMLNVNRRLALFRIRSAIMFNQNELSSYIIMITLTPMPIVKQSVLEEWKCVKRFKKKLEFRVIYIYKRELDYIHKQLHYIHEYIAHAVQLLLMTIVNKCQCY